MFHEDQPLKGATLKSMLHLLKVVLEESGTICGIDTHRDWLTISERFKQEGDEFLTITLPTFAKDLYRALDAGKVENHLFLPFGRAKGQVLPKFLGGFLSILFDSVSGLLINTSDVSALEADAVRCIVQISGLLGKLHLPCTPKRVQKAMDRYIDNDSRVGEHNPERRAEALSVLGFSDSDLRLTLWSHFGNFLNDLNLIIKRGSIVPSHGPGAVVESLRGNAKWRQSAWSEQLESVFPFSRWAYSSYLNYLEDLDNDQVEDPGPALPVKVIAVPKTQNTPRIIAVEPVAMQYMQQALRSAFEEALSRHPSAYKLIGYGSQLPNQEMAYLGSLYGDLATLDLSDASDLVSNELVINLLHEWPYLLEAIQATRSKTALVNLDSGDITVTLNKFASMGSALCFPIESLVFATIVLMVVDSGRGNLNRSFYAPGVRVYGDDIIVPVDFAQLTAWTLEACGLKVNHDKSFWTGRFRESCGKEYYAGFDVSYVKVRAVLPTLSKPLGQDVDSTVSTVALRNNLWNHGWFQTVDYLDQLLYKRLKGVYPVVSPTSSVLGRVSWTNFTVDRMSSDLHAPLVRGYVISGNPPSSSLDGYAALMKCLAKRSELPNPDPRHLLRGGRPVVLRIKLRMAPVF
jgi:hypothetical protein